MPIPPDIVSYLTSDEEIMKIGNAREWRIYVTNKRVIFRKRVALGEEIIQDSYRHISIEYEKENPWALIVVGICAVVFAFLFNVLFPINYPFFGSTIGIVTTTFLIGVVSLSAIFMLIGLLIQPSFKIGIVARDPVEISGRRLEEIIRAIYQYQEKRKQKSPHSCIIESKPIPPLNIVDGFERAEHDSNN